MCAPASRHGEGSLAVAQRARLRWHKGLACGGTYSLAVRATVVVVIFLLAPRTQKGLPAVRATVIIVAISALRHARRRSVEAPHATAIWENVSRLWDELHPGSMALEVLLPPTLSP